MSLSLCAPAQAVLFLNTADPTHNTSAPTGALEGSGWQWLGTWGGFLGTPVHPKFFLTAAHIGGQIGDGFQFRGQTYLTRAAVTVPNSDLRLWQVCGTFPDFAPLHTATNLIGQDLVWFGRGTQRGDEVRWTNGGPTELRGWRWGAKDRVIRWGENRIEEVLVLDDDGGVMLRATFDPNSGFNECHLSTGDSGGPAFVREPHGWQLAGINYAVDGPYSYLPIGQDPFQAALFDHQGFFVLDAADWVPATEDDSSAAGSLYASSVAAHSEWILSFLNQTHPPDDAPVLQVASSVDGPYVDATEVELDMSERTLALDAPTRPSFFRLRGCQSTRIASIRLDAGRLLLDYQ